MYDGRQKLRRAAPVCAALLAAALFAPSLANAQGGTLAVSVEAGGSPSTSAALDAALRQELGRLERVEVTRTSSARYVVRGSITELERVRRDGGTHLRCTVSLVIAERRSGAIRLMLSGRAAAHAQHVQAKRRAVAAAVRGALRPLPRTIPLAGPLAMR